MIIMVSECLLGHNCKYDGGNNRHYDYIENALAMIIGKLVALLNKGQS